MTTDKYEWPKDPKRALDFWPPRISKWIDNELRRRSLPGLMGWEFDALYHKVLHYMSIHPTYRDAQAHFIYNVTWCILGGTDNMDEYEVLTAHTIVNDPVYQELEVPKPVVSERTPPRAKKKPPKKIRRVIRKARM